MEVSEPQRQKYRDEVQAELNYFLNVYDTPFIIAEMKAEWGSQAWQRRYVDKYDKYFDNSTQNRYIKIHAADVHFAKGALDAHMIGE